MQRNIMSIRSSQSLVLPDGRLLGYAEFGHPTGSPLLYFHGFPMSRLEGWMTDKVARRQHIRVISVDRPGYGLSTFQPHRRITDWPADVQALASQLDISRFAVLGMSGGGPYALACAHSLPQEMLSAVGVMCGAPPVRRISINCSLCPSFLRQLNSRATCLCGSFVRGFTDNKGCSGRLALISCRGGRAGPTGQLGIALACSGSCQMRWWVL